MNSRSSVLFLLLCGFAGLTVSSQPCGTEMLEGTSCTMKITIKSGETLSEVRWVHDSSGGAITWKNNKIRGTIQGAALGDDKSLKLEKVTVKNSGSYTYTAFNSDGTQISDGKQEIKVYANVPKPTVKVNCKSGNATLSCETGVTDLTITWLKDDKAIVSTGKELFLTVSQIQESKPYSCSASNPLNSQKSDSVKVSCEVPGLKKIFGFPLWIMISILAGGGALVLLMICVLIICCCRSCRQSKKQQQEEAELRLQNFNDSEHSGTNRSKHTARGQPAPPIPQEEPINGSPSPQTTPRIQAQPKAQTRARPPPPPQDDDDEDPPPLPRPRKQHRTKRMQEPYRPME